MRPVEMPQTGTGRRIDQIDDGLQRPQQQRPVHRASPSNRLQPHGERVADSRLRKIALPHRPFAGLWTSAMDIIFDTARIEQNRHRALRNNDPKAAFLLDIAAEELGERLAVVERTFEHAVELHGATGAAARAAKAPARSPLSRASKRERLREPR
jgi:hypothetical protein